MVGAVSVAFVLVTADGWGPVGVRGDLRGAEFATCHQRHDQRTHGHHPGPGAVRWILWGAETRIRVVTRHSSDF